MSIETLHDYLHHRPECAASRTREHMAQDRNLPCSCGLEAILAHLQPSPDLRGLVEQWRNEADAGRQAAERSDRHEQRLSLLALARVRMSCADELEAALATTPEPTQSAVNVPD